MKKKLSLTRLSIDMVKNSLKLIEGELEDYSGEKKGGRPRIYYESFILLTPYFLHKGHISFRDAVFYLEEALKVKMPQFQRFTTDSLD